MYYLAKFCRICIKTANKLFDVNVKDYDSVPLSEKLRVCTEMVITSESLSTKICFKCIEKLRISYEFNKMCKKSTSILEQHLLELLSSSKEVTADGFVNSDLQTIIDKIKIEQQDDLYEVDIENNDCSLLQQMLTEPLQELESRRHNHDSRRFSGKTFSNYNSRQVAHGVNDYNALQRILQFTQKYDFGYATNKSISENCDLNPLEKLQRFTNTFFFDHFADYRNTILHARDYISFDSDDEFFEEETPDNDLKPSQIVSAIKQELVVVEPEMGIKQEIYWVNDCKPSTFEKEEGIYVVKKRRSKAQLIKQITRMKNSLSENKYNSPSKRNNLIEGTIEKNEKLFQKIKNIHKLKYSCFQNQKCVSQFISQELQNQFLNQNFRCKTCNRTFKSLGFLKTHCIKLKH